MKYLFYHILKLFGRLLIIIGAVLGIIGRALSNTRPDISSPILMVCFVTFFVGLYIWRKAKKQIAKRMMNINLNTDTFILYLRPFFEDQNTKTSISNLWLVGPFNFLNITTEEEDLAAKVKKYGVLTCVGKPQENLPELGAKRLYFKEYEWRLWVSEAIQKARFILLLAGNTPNFEWELEQVLKLGDRQKVVILIRNNEEEYRAIRQLIYKVSNILIPPYKWRFLRAKIDTILYFENYNKPMFYNVKLFYFQMKYDPVGYAVKKILKRISSNRSTYS